MREFEKGEKKSYSPGEIRTLKSGFFKKAEPSKCPFCGAPISKMLKEWQCDRCDASGSLHKAVLGLTSPKRCGGWLSR